MILVIDASAADRTLLVLCQEGRLVARRSLRRMTHDTERMLPAIDALLRSKRMQPDALSGIAVVRGPGSFTAIRLSVAIANTFGRVLGIPVAGIRSDEVSTMRELVALAGKRLRATRRGTTVRPFYGRPPHITRSKTRS